MNRYHIVNAWATYAALRDRADIRARINHRKSLHDLCDVPMMPYCHDTEWTILRALDTDLLPHVLRLVALEDGAEEAERLRDGLDRIARPDGVTIRLETSDDDPFQVVAAVNDPIADAWADAHGSLAGGTWQADGSSCVYDILYWHPGIVQELSGDGYRLDCSQLYEPGPDDLVIAQHASHCDDCDGDYRQAEKHLDAITRDRARCVGCAADVERAAGRDPFEFPHVCGKGGTQS